MGSTRFSAGLGERAGLEMMVEPFLSLTGRMMARYRWYSSQIQKIVQLTSPQKDLVRILKQSGQIVPDFLKPLPDGTYKGSRTPRVIKQTL